MWEVYCPRCDKMFVSLKSRDHAIAKMEFHAQKHDDYAPVMLEDDKPATEGN